MLSKPADYLNSPPATENETGCITAEKGNEILDSEPSVLRQSTNFIQSLLDNMRDGVFTVDQNGIMHSFNGAAEHLFAFTAAELKGRDFKLLIPDPFYSEYASHMQHYVQTGELMLSASPREILGQRKNGSLIPIEVTLGAFEMEDQTVFIAITRDISQRIKTEQDIRDREARIDAIIDTAVDGIITIDEQGIVETYNHSAESLFGYAANEVIGHNVKMLMPQPYAADHDGYLRNYRSTNTAKIIGIGREVIGQRKDGTTFPMELSVAEVRLGNSRIFTGIVRDISGRLAAQAELIEFKNTLDQTLDCAYMFDVNTLQFIYVNRTGCEEIGYSEGELKKMRPFDIKPEFDEASFRAMIVQLQESTKGSHRFETVHRHKDGHDIPVEISLQYIPRKDRAGYFIAIVRNIVERKLIEEQLLKAKEEAEKANRAKSNFLSRMSHELRTPLTAILGFGQILEMHGLKPRDLECVGHIIKAGRHLTDLINEVLDIARIESGHQNLSPEPVHVDRILDDAWSLIRPLAAERHIQFKHTPCEQDNKHVLADLQRLKQVLLNLMSNAIKYNHDGGVVTLFCAEVREGIIRISISDTGPGISADNRKRIFEPFERLNADHSDVQGSGLGLALSKALIEGMGGIMNVDSEPGIGSTFWLELPLIDEVTSAQIIAAKPTLSIHEELGVTQVRSARLLYIEDNIANFRLLEAALSLRPHIELIAAMHGELGIDLALQNPPDLILLDQHLPGLLGNEVLARLKSHPKTQGIPVVIISADATSHQIEKLLYAGAYAYVTKPFNIKELLNMIDTVLATRKKDNAKD